MARRAKHFEKDLPEEERIFYYKSEEDDPIQTEGQEKGEPVKLPEDYVFIHKNPFLKLYSAILYRVFKLFARYYAKSYLQMTVVGREKFKKIKKDEGYVLYGNHSNSFHDAYSPALIADRRIYTITTAIALQLPFVGKLFPYLGGLPLGTSPATKKRFHEAVDTRLRQGNCLVLYPEAHLWPYYTGIRKFPAGDKSFTYPARNNLPMFTMTTTYQKSKKKNQLRPRMTVYIDGPFYPDPKKTEAENRAALAKEAYDSMKKWSKKSNYDYIKYIKIKEKK